MIHLKLSYHSQRRLPFYLAMEEWAARTLPSADYFFSWRVNPTVICGRNQEMDKEVDMDYCRSKGIDVVRRRSGGGCVYADHDNFMFSYVCPGDEVTNTFSRYTTMIASSLRQLGMEASATGRNDIVISGKKVSGNAFYHLPGRCIVHGTMLYDFNPEVMGKAITPSRAKLESKAVKSVQSRVTSLRAEGIQLTPEDFETQMISMMCESEIILTEEDLKAVEEIEKTYYLPEFLYRKGESIQFSLQDDRIIRRGRVEGVGEMEFSIRTDSANRIENIYVCGDFFLLEDPEQTIFSRLKGILFERSYAENALKNLQVEKSIANLSNSKLLDLLFPAMTV